MNRRRFLQSALLLTAAPLNLLGISSALSGEIMKITKTKTEWQQQLTPEQYAILREEGTEPPFTSPLNNEHRRGVFVCAGCDLELFLSEMKYDSGTGWPSFFTTIEGNLETKLDFTLVLPRTEYHCARCGGHQGHLFHESGSPSGKRYCNNGLALAFRPA